MLSLRYSSQHALLSLTVKKLLLLSNLYSKHLNRLNNRSNNHSNLCNNKLQLPKALCLKALLPLSNRLNRPLFRIRCVVGVMPMEAFQCPLLII